MEYYNCYLTMIKEFCIKYDNELLKNIIPFFEYYLEDEDIERLDTIVEITKEYLKKHGFEVLEM